MQEECRATRLVLGVGIEIRSEGITLLVSLLRANQLAVGGASPFCCRVVLFSTAHKCKTSVERLAFALPWGANRAVQIVGLCWLVAPLH